MFRAHVLIVRRAKLYITVSGIITPIGGRPVYRLRVDGQQNIKKRKYISFRCVWSYDADNKVYFRYGRK